MGGGRGGGRATLHHPSIYIFLYIIFICIVYYFYMLTPPHPPELPRGAAITPPMFLRLSFWRMIQGSTLGLEVRRRQHMRIGSSLHFEFLRPFTQILRQMSSPTMTVISVKVAFRVVSDQSPSNTYV